MTIDNGHNTVTLKPLCNQTRNQTKVKYEQYLMKLSRERLCRNGNDKY